MAKTPKKYIESINQYHKLNTRQINIRLHKKYDADIIDKLESMPAKATYIKQLIRDDIRLCGNMEGEQ